MCAINGITANDRARVLRMNEATKHRGPDGTEVWEGEGITFGHNRLAIIDLSDAALQPMHSRDSRYTIVFNGEIYNYRELRSELASTYTFSTASDTEVLLAAYAAWGEGMFTRLRGIFAFGIWDKSTRTLLLARDHMGVKPLYYTIDRGTLTFSSEIPAILRGTEGAVLDRTSLAFYLSMEYVPAPRTLVEHVKKLPPGHALTWKDGVATTRSFLDPIPQKRPGARNEVYATIDAAVKRQLVSDRPMGAYLSGGFDSSIVVHHMAKYVSRPRTYSVNFEAVRGEEGEAAKFNADAELALKTAACFGTEHKTFTITLGDIHEHLETAIASANEPIANSTAITQYLLSDFVRKDGVVVVQGGDAGDELFGGYTRHRIAMGAYLYQRLPKLLQTLGGAVSPRVAKLSTPFGTALHRTLMVRDEKKLWPFLAQHLPINAPTASFFDHEYAHEAGRAEHPLDTFMRVDRRTWLPDECFIRSDYASMAHGIELRVPLADVDVVRLSDELSVWEKTLPFEGKRVIRQVYRGVLPGHLYGQPKRGWLSPAAKWFRDPQVNALAREVFSSGYYSGLDSVFDWDRVHELLDAHVAKRGYHLYPLWNIFVLQIWARTHHVHT